jgi:hypothetical protein
MTGDGDSAAYGEHKQISRADFLDHCRDRGCIALSCVSARGEALFIAWDIDRRFYQRLDGFREALDARGMADAAIIVDGSTMGHGKIILTLGAPIPQAQAMRLVADVLADAARHPCFGAYSGADITTFPQSGQGGHVRVFGRNRKRRGQGLCEAILDWNADPLWSLASIIPAMVETEATEARNMVPKAKPFHRLPAPVQALLSEPYRRRGGEVFADIVRLARAASMSDDGNAEAIIGEYVRQIIDHSPNMSAGARAQFLRPDIQARAIRYVRSSASFDKLGGWQSQFLGTIHDHGLSMVPEKARCAYEALAGYVAENRLEPHALGITYGRIADLAGFPTKSVAQRAIIEAEDAELLVRLDHGQPVKGGLCTLFSLVGNGETISDAISKGIETDAFQRRVADREARGIGRPSCMRLESSDAA